MIWIVAVSSIANLIALVASGEGLDGDGVEMERIILFH